MKMGKRFYEIIDEVNKLDCQSEEGKQLADELMNELVQVQNNYPINSHRYNYVGRVIEGLDVKRNMV